MKIEDCADCPARFVCPDDYGCTVQFGDEECDKTRAAIVEFNNQKQSNESE